MAPLCLAAAVVGAPGPSRPAVAATFAPPMLDISRQCETSARHNMRAMSECVVAESEARAEIFQKWSQVPDASAERCLKAVKKARRLPYATIAKCLVDEAAAPPPAAAPVAVPAAAPPPAAAGPSTPAAPSTSALSRFKRFFTPAQ